MSGTQLVLDVTARPYLANIQSHSFVWRWSCRVELIGLARSCWDSSWSISCI